MKSDQWQYGNTLWVGMSIANIVLVQLKIQGHCKNADFESMYIRTHTEEGVSKISNLAFAIFLFSYKNTYHPQHCKSWLLMKPSDAPKNG